MKEKEQRIIQEIANEEGLRYTEAFECVQSQFDFVKQTMAKGEFEAVHLPYFGKFWVDPRRVENINSKKNGKSEQ
jgi:nucleoid DNA-binding protein